MKTQQYDDKDEPFNVPTSVSQSVRLCILYNFGGFLCRCL